LSKHNDIRLAYVENEYDKIVQILLGDHSHIILLDMTMQGSSDTARKISRHFPLVKIVALAAPEDEIKIIECAQIGISGYVTRDATIDILVNTILSTDNGEFCCPQKISSLLLSQLHHYARDVRWAHTSKSKSNQNKTLLDLTRREHQILNLMAEGMSNKQIAALLVIEISTVKNHVHNILVKLGAQNRVQAVNVLNKHDLSNRSKHFPLTG
jgi:DNA-binding NarL/FixJ family response regulator